MVDVIAGLIFSSKNVHSLYRFLDEEYSTLSKQKSALTREIKETKQEYEWITEGKNLDAIQFPKGYKYYSGYKYRKSALVSIAKNIAFMQTVRTTMNAKNMTLKKAFNSNLDFFYQV